MKVRLKQLLHAEHQQQMKFTGKASGPRPLPVVSVALDIKNWQRRFRFQISSRTESSRPTGPNDLLRRFYYAPVIITTQSQ